MKIRMLVGATVFCFLFAAIGHADDKDKDKNKPTPPPKHAVAAQQKPAPKPQQKPAAKPQQKPVVVQQKPASQPQQKPVAVPQKPPAKPQQKPVSPPRPNPAGHPAEATTRVSDRGTPHSGGPGPQHSQQHMPVMRHVDPRDLHQRMSAPASREVLVKARDHYHRVELTKFKVRGRAFIWEPRHRVVLGHLRIVPATYYHRRAVFYETFGYVPPIYIYSLRPSYGLWCSTFLAFMLDRIAIGLQPEYSLMYYDHMNEPEFREWRQEMDGLAADNAELRAKLAVMDQRIALLEGTQRNPAYIPDEAGDVALSPEAIDKLTSGPEKY